MSIVHIPGISTLEIQAVHKQVPGILMTLYYNQKRLH